jgi:hypothetical protein
VYFDIKLGRYGDATPLGRIVMELKVGGLGAGRGAAGAGIMWGAARRRGGTSAWQWCPAWGFPMQRAVLGKGRPMWPAARGGGCLVPYPLR